MDIDELQSVQSRERQTDSLQQLRESFYTEASEYVQQLRDARDDAAERADDPWDDPEVNRLTDEINTAEQTVEAIYDRRTGKIVKKASLAAADMPTDEEGLTTEEQALFESLVADIEDNRTHVLDMIAGDVAPDSSPVSTDTDATTASEPAAASTTEDSRPVPPDPDPEPEADSGVSAADVMGGSESSQSDPAPPSDADPRPPEEGQPPADPHDGPEAAAGSGRGGDSASGDDSAPEDEPTTITRTTVQITEDVGEIFGIDQREYDLSRNDVVTLPEANAGALLDRDAAQKID